MSGSFTWVSLMIESALASAAINVRHLGEPAHPDPAVGPAVPGVLFHEAVHFWQVMASGYLCGLAAEEWTRLEKWLSGTRLPPGPIRIALDRVDITAGFSPRDLVEALARMWEVHVGDKETLVRRALARDPPDHAGLAAELAGLLAAGAFARGKDQAYSGQAFDLALRAVGGSYARPYLRVRDALGSYRAAAIFPVIGHFALQTTQPTASFLALIDPAVAALEPVAPGEYIHDAWRRLYVALRVRGLWTGPPLVLGGILAGQPPLDRHPVFAWAKARMHALETGELSLEEGADIRASAPPDAPDEWVRYLALDRMLALPGDPVARVRLLRHLPPVAVRYRDGSASAVADLCRRSLGRREAAAASDPSPDVLAMAESYSIDEAWRAFYAGKPYLDWKASWGSPALPGWVRRYSPDPGRGPLAYE